MMKSDLWFPCSFFIMDVIMKINILFFLCIFSGAVLAGNVCYIEGSITDIVPSDGDTAISVEAPPGNCSCSASTSERTFAWINIDTDGGKSMFSAALSAKISGSNVLVTKEDDMGQGSSENNSITYRWWLSCRVRALQVK